MWRLIIFFVVGVLQGTVATLELIYTAEKKMRASLVTTALSSLMAWVMAVWIVEDPGRRELLVPWVSGDVVACILGLWIRKKIDG